MNKFKSLLLVASIFVTIPAGAADRIRIAIGTQDTTINCAAGGAVVRELHLLENICLTTATTRMRSTTSFGITLLLLNSELLADKLDIGNMADFPAVLGASAFQTSNNGVRTYYIATLSGGVTGAGNAIHDRESGLKLFADKVWYVSQGGKLAAFY